MISNALEKDNFGFICNNKKMNKIFDCIIIGGGPSGLAAGNILAKSGIDFLVIDKGDYLYNRNQDTPEDIVAGVGGGGLYSDGKVSFFPSGSNLYNLEPLLVIKSYQLLNELFQNFSIDIPEFNNDWLNNKLESNNNQQIQNKQYESNVLSQVDLYKIGFYLYDQIGKDKFLIKHIVKKIKQDKNVYKIEVVDSEGENRKVINTRSVIFCGGKFGSFNFPSFVDENLLVFKKFEFGIRIETEHENFDYKELKQTDLKLLMQSQENKGIEFRTFCFCRKGYIVHGKFEEINSFNGISNKSEHTKTNFGINLRIKDETTYNLLKEELTNLIQSHSIIELSVKEFLSKQNVGWNNEIYDLFHKCLTTHFPILSNSNAKVIGPSFEYFGYYPKLTNELKLFDQNFWVCGDATGDFRGLMPSLASGFLAAISFVEKDKKDKANLYDLIRLKVSPTKKTKTIFTAQSKKFFYAKDVICEYVFKEGYIPINPFQVFGYFLNDRVDRAMVRNGNNQLISRCDELWVFGPIADGVLFEISRAYQLKIPIRFFTIGTLKKEITEITDLNKLTFEPEVYSQIGKENLLRFISQSYINDESQKVQLKLGFDEFFNK
ncbi:MAG: hypothetical protein A2W99_08770 [Bacteroidetes bacterium GWF2_33_16]|nr:MAG: hypothetical protein A2X00_00385 [Bacteroidetes bacterium GWE2_32_14]OFY05592.1 MAG: hypothetical protein A2W99_08770 [Bacteroidetes bacterium GWF2_33_16]